MSVLVCLRVMEKVKDGRVTSGNVMYWPCTIFSNKKNNISYQMLKLGHLKKMLILTCFQKHISKDLSIWKLRRPIAFVTFCIS